MREKLRNKIKHVFGTQDKCAYSLRIENGTLSRIINCTKDPSAVQIKRLCNALGLTKKEVLKKHEAEEIND